MHTTKVPHEQRELIFVVNHAAFFASHRLPLAEGMIDKGWHVTLLTGQAGSKTMEPQGEAAVKAAGIPHFRFGFTPDGVNIFKEFGSVVQMTRLVSKLSPQIIHCASPKGVLYGGLAARVLGVRGLVLAMSGLGYAFTGSKKPSLKRQIIRYAISTIWRYIFRHPNLVVIVQNREDYEYFTSEYNLSEEKQVRLVPGSGVDLAMFNTDGDIRKKQQVLFAGRILEDKGIIEFLDAVSQLKPKYKSWRFVIAGAADYNNPSLIDRSRFDKLVAKAGAIYLGHVDNIAPIYLESSIVCLPSYREGMPKVLLEAAAAGCAVVTTDVAGCREAIIEGETGDLVPVGNSRALAETLSGLMSSPEKVRRYSDAGKALAGKKFSLQAVQSTISGIYEEMLGCDEKQ